MVYKGVTITANDYQTLEEGEFLNDLVIEFYLTYLKNEVLNKEDRDKVYVFSSYFYGRLTQVSDKHAPYEKDKSLTEAQRQYKRVERWTKNVDLFEKVNNYYFTIFRISFFEFLFKLFVILCVRGL